MQLSTRLTVGGVKEKRAKYTLSGARVCDRVPKSDTLDLFETFFKSSVDDTTFKLLPLGCRS